MADAARRSPSDDDLLSASDSHPSLKPLPQVEQYMRLRASDHHALPDDEEQLLAALVQRAHEVEEYRIGVQPSWQPVPGHVAIKLGTGNPPHTGPATAGSSLHTVIKTETSRVTNSQWLSVSMS